jgi:hypothetical protein
MSKITGLENIRELYDMWSRNQVATYKYEGLEVFGTKERVFSLPGNTSKEEIESLVKELKGRKLPILGDWQTSTFCHADFYVHVEIDGIPVKVEFSFGGDRGGEADIDLDGKIHRNYGPHSRTTRFADFQGCVASQTVDLKVSRSDGGTLKANQIRDMLDSIRLGLPGFVGWFEFSNDNREKSSELSANGRDEDSGWTFFDSSLVQDWDYEDALWICRFWSFCPIQNRPMTPEEQALTKTHRSLRGKGGSFSLDEIRSKELEPAIP